MTGQFNPTLTEVDFNKWQKALKKFSRHEQSKYHKHGVDMVQKRSRNVAEMLTFTHASEKADNFRAL